MIIKLLKNIKVGKISFLIFLIMFQISLGKTEEKDKMITFVEDPEELKKSNFKN